VNVLFIGFLVLPQLTYTVARERFLNEMWVCLNLNDTRNNPLIGPIFLRIYTSITILFVPKIQIRRRIIQRLNGFATEETLTKKTIISLL
jgi:hypothetical protein